MALFISQKDDRSELQKQIAVELQRKIKDNSQLSDRPDGIEDSAYIKGTKTTSNLAGAWIIIPVVAVVIIIWLTVLSLSR